MLLVVETELIQSQRFKVYPMTTLHKFPLFCGPSMTWLRNGLIVFWLVRSQRVIRCESVWLIRYSFFNLAIEKLNILTFSHDFGFVRFVWVRLTERRTTRNTHPSSYNSQKKLVVVVWSRQCAPTDFLLPLRIELDWLIFVHGYPKNPTGNLHTLWVCIPRRYLHHFSLFVFGVFS